eukprot:scaffold45006_cov29-Tisochrysis_lutea.AAC.7
MAARGLVTTRRRQHGWLRLRLASGLGRGERLIGLRPDTEEPPSRRGEGSATVCRARGGGVADWAQQHGRIMQQARSRGQSRKLRVAEERVK